MPNNRLSVLFDRKPRHSKSTSDLSEAIVPEFDNYQPQWRTPKKRKSKEALTVLQEYNFKPLPPPPPKTVPKIVPKTVAQTVPQKQLPRAPSQQRASTTPLMHPPDELFLRMIRRRSLDARLEELRIEQEQHRRQQQQLSQRHDPELDMRLAFASAIPPIYFDLPPEYASPDNYSQPAIPPRHPGREKRNTSPRASSKARNDELFLHDPLNVEIDATIAQYASISITEPTPTDSPRESATLVSPINDIDHMYLERRKQRKTQERKKVS